MQVNDVISHLEQIAPVSLQESYDNSGLVVGERSAKVTGVLISLDCTEAVVHEAIAKGISMIVSHHPIVFSGLKRFNNANYVQRTVQLAIKNDIALYAIHTNLDNVYKNGVNGKIAERLGLENTRILAPKSGDLVKLATYCPVEHSDNVKEALFAAGAGHIGEYSECSFAMQGMGTFKPSEHSNPVMGERGVRQKLAEDKLEFIIRKPQQESILKVLFESHPYEEVAYELLPMLNSDMNVGSGMIGELEQEMSVEKFLTLLKDRMDINLIKHTSYTKNIKSVAVCGGSGQFLLRNAKHSKADVYVTSDFKYHEYFDAEDDIMICDIGHYESEKYTIDLLYDILSKKFSTFAVLKTGVDTNPVKYFL